MPTTQVVTIEDVRSVSPTLAKYTEDVIVKGAWKRPQLSARDRSLVTVAALVASERTIGFRHYFILALTTGVTPAEMSEMITHVAFYAGWSTAFSAVSILKDIFSERDIRSDQLPNAAPELLPAGQALPGDDARKAALQERFATIVPGLVDITNDLLYGDVWLRPALSVRDRSLITVAALMATGQTEFLEIYLAKTTAAGVTRDEISETITHLAFYIGWPAALSAATVVKRHFDTPRD